MNFKHFWDSISNWHLSGNMERLELLKARILNQYSFLLAFLFFFNGTRDLFFGLSGNFYIFFVIGIIFLLLFFFTKARFNDLVVFITLLVCCGFVFIFSSYEGFENGLSMYYLGIVLATTFVFNDKKHRFYCLFIYLLILVLFYIGNNHDFLMFRDFEKERIIASSKDVRIHTFTQITLLIIFNGYFILLKNNAIVDLFQQKVRSENIILKMNEKLNGSGQSAVIEDVVKLAMSDDIAFLPMFKQIFPKFYENLSKVNPDLTGDEFKFCALLKLGFTTKDIAAYNHLAIRSVQTRKNRLRKSFRLSSHEDLYTWIDTF